MGTRVRDTSIKTYHDREDDGSLSLRRRQVLSVLEEIRPATGGRVARVVKERFGDWAHSETIRNRLTELRDGGAVCELDDRAPCPESGNMSIQWDVTGEPYRQPEKRATKREAIDHLWLFLDSTRLALNSGVTDWADWHQRAEALLKSCERFRR